MNERISILEDSIEVQKRLEAALISSGYQVRVYSTAQSFEADIESWEPDVCVLDMGLPDKDGLDILGFLAANFDTAILVVSGRSSLSDKIAGLELGADDYLAKPFEVPEFVARVRALIRRKKPKPARHERNTSYSFAGFTADLSKFLLTDDKGNAERLSASEAALLEIFLSRPNRLISRDKIRDELGDHGDEYSFDRAIDVRVSRLRNKLKDSTKDSKIIKTVYGAGYVLISQVEKC